MAVITVQFQVGVPRTEALVRLYDVLNANQDWLPAGLGTLPPIVKPSGIDDDAGAGRHAVDPRRGQRQRTGPVAPARWRPRFEARARRARGATIGGPGMAVQVTLHPGRLRSVA